MKTVGLAGYSSGWECYINNGFWHPSCPYCNTTLEIELEIDTNINLTCPFCDKEFRVEGYFK